ncbi:WhiB family transcriptional regulator [Geodermatophilus sp. SYSU D00079]
MAVSGHRDTDSGTRAPQRSAAREGWRGTGTTAPAHRHQATHPTHHQQPRDADHGCPTAVPSSQTPARPVAATSQNSKQQRSSPPLYEPPAESAPRRTIHRDGGRGRAKSQDPPGPGPAPVRQAFPHSSGTHERANGCPIAAQLAPRPRPSTALAKLAAGRSPGSDEHVGGCGGVGLMPARVERGGGGRWPQDWSRRRPWPSTERRSSEAEVAYAALGDALARVGGRTPCRVSGRPDDWYEDGTPPGRAAELCAGCPVAAECLAAALAGREVFGVWGGMDPQMRRRLLRQQGCRAPVSPVAVGQ